MVNVCYMDPTPSEKTYHFGGIILNEDWLELVDLTYLRVALSGSAKQLGSSNGKLVNQAALLGPQNDARNLRDQDT